MNEKQTLMFQSETGTSVFVGTTIKPSESKSDKPIFEYKKQGERDTDMSYLLTATFKNEIYIAADSRSTVNHSDGSKSYTDDYQKIVIIPDTNIVVASTGLNSFGEQNFRDIAYSLEGNSQKEIFADLVSKIKKYEILYEQVAYLYCSSMCQFDKYINDLAITTTYFTENFKNQSICNKIINQQGFFSSGATYANKITEHLDIDQFRENTVESIGKIMQGVIEISPCFDNTVGGPIQMVRITPEKAEWVDGFKPDFIK